MTPRTTIAAAAAIMLCGRPGFAAEPTPVRVTVADTVLRAAVPCIGFNVCQNPIEDKSTLLYNCLNPNPGLEDGVIFRRLVVTGGGDAKTFTISGDQTQRGIPTNFWVGAEYRVLAGKAAGRRGKIAACVYGKPWPWCTRFTVEGLGPAFAAGDLIWLNSGGNKAPLNSWGLQRAVEGEHAPFHGGNGCAQLVMDPFWKLPLIWLPSFKRHGGGRGGDREGNADRFLQEKTYRITLWAKGTPGAKGSVRFVASSEPGNAMPDDFVLTNVWSKYELIRKSDPMVNLCVAISSGGHEMYLDDFTISEDDGGDPCAILPRVVNALADLTPGALRFLGGARGDSLDNWLAHPLERLRVMECDRLGNKAYRDPNQPNLPDSLNLCERVGVSPWLVVGLAMTEEEWADLLEYLAGPETSPYGARRARNGQPDAWFKTFDKVYLELGDEVWNSANAPWVVPDPALYAAWAEHIFSRVRKSPYYTPRLRLVASGHLGDDQWNEAVLKGCPSMDVLSCSAELRAPANAGPAVAQAQRLTELTAQAQTQLTAAAHAANAAGKALALGGCETVSEEGSFLGPERSLLRSETAAVAMLDALLLAVAVGSEAVEFSRFAQGSDNATHVDAHAMALHPTALAIRLFNQHAGGKDLVSSSLTPRPGGLTAGVPALVSYAFKGQSDYCVLLLNRSLKEAFKATLKLPMGSVKVHGYRIAAMDPMASNLNEIQVKAEEFESDPDAGIVVPAHSIVLAETGAVTK